MPAAQQDPSRPAAGLLNKLTSQRSSRAAFKIAIPAPAFTGLN